MEQVAAPAPAQAHTCDWLAEEAAHLERGLLRSFARLAQVQLEVQVRAWHAGLLCRGSPRRPLPAACRNKAGSGRR